jgi:hypothetical protein
MLHMERTDHAVLPHNCLVLADGSLFILVPLEALHWRLDKGRSRFERGWDASRQGFLMYTVLSYVYCPFILYS